jgi:hypothetical protein
MGERRTAQPAFEFEPEPLPSEQGESEASSSMADNVDPAEVEALLKGEMCGECDMVLGTGTCARCIRIKNARGGHDPKIPVKRRKVVKSGIAFHDGPGTPQWAAMKQRVADDVARHKSKLQTPEEKFLDRWSKMSAEEREAYTKKQLGHDDPA